jgi:hypothetical protein
MASAGNKVFSFSLVNGQMNDRSAASRSMESCLSNNQQYTSLVQVRKNIVSAFLDGKLIVAYRTDYTNVTEEERFELPDSETLGLATYNAEVIFHRIEVKEVTGRGKFLRK